MVRALTRHWHHRLRALTRFAGAREGATAVEFALLAPAFIALVVAIFQVAVYIYAESVLQNAATQTGRLFLTGQVQGNNWNQTTVKNKACTFAGTMFNCNSLILSVQTYQDFASASTATPALNDGNGNPITSWPFNYGTQGQIMVVQVIYPWAVVGGPLGFTINAGSMMGVASFRVEPY